MKKPGMDHIPIEKVGQDEADKYKQILKESEEIYEKRTVLKLAGNEPWKKKMIADYIKELVSLNDQ